MSHRRGSQDGSVLLPVVVAMLILGLAGAALSELFAAQRMAAVGMVESRQAFWAGEAGLWHAAFDQGAIPSPVTFAGSTYTVVQKGSIYAATAVRHDSTRQVTGSLSGPVALSNDTDPLDSAASAASAYQHDAGHFHVAFVSDHAKDVEISSVVLTCNKVLVIVDEFKLGGVDLWTDGSGIWQPVVTMYPKLGSVDDRTIAAGAAPDALFGFASSIPSGTTAFTLIVTFTNGTSSWVYVSLTW